MPRQIARSAGSSRRATSRVLAGCVLLLGAAFSTGCLGFVHPVHTPGADDLQPCQAVPQACKNHVHVFLVHGLDPLDLGNLEGLREYLQSLGFIKTWYGMPFHAFYFEKRIIDIHKEDPAARFVLMGFSYGAGLARDIVNDMCKAGIPADLLVYIDGVKVHQRPLDRPANALHVVNILSCYRDGAHNLTGAANTQYDDVWHFGVPTHPDTLKMLARELAAVALRVPIVEPVLPPLPPGEAPPRPLPNTLPPPASAPQVLPPPLPESAQPSSADWGFLEADRAISGASGNKPIAEAWATQPAYREK